MLFRNDLRILSYYLDSRAGGNLEHIDHLDIYDLSGYTHNSTLNAYNEYINDKNIADLASNDEWIKIRDRVQHKILSSEFLNSLNKTDLKNKIMPIIWEIFPSKEKKLFNLMKNNLIDDGAEEGLFIPLKSYNHYDTAYACRVSNEFSKILENLILYILLNRCFLRVYPQKLKIKSRKGDNISKGKINRQLLFPESRRTEIEYGVCEAALAYNIFKRDSSVLSLFSTGVDIANTANYQNILENTEKIYNDYISSLNLNVKGIIPDNIQKKLLEIGYYDIIFDDYSRYSYIVQFDKLLDNDSLHSYCLAIDSDLKRHVILHRAIFLLIAICPLGLSQFMLKAIIGNKAFWKAEFISADINQKEAYLSDIASYLYKVVFKVLPALSDLVNDYIGKLTHGEAEEFFYLLLKKVQKNDIYSYDFKQKNYHITGLNRLNSYLYTVQESNNLIKDTIQLKSLIWLIYKNNTLDFYKDIPGRYTNYENFVKPLKLIRNIRAEHNEQLNNLVFQIIKLIAIADHKKHKLKNELWEYSEKEREEKWEKLEKEITIDIINGLDKNLIYEYYKARFYIRDYKSARVSIDSIDNFTMIWCNLINSEKTSYRPTGSQGRDMHKLNCERVKWGSLIRVDYKEFEKKFIKGLRKLLKKISESKDKSKYETALTCRDSSKWILSNWKGKDVLNDYSQGIYIMIEEMLDYLWIANYGLEKQSVIEWERYWRYHNTLTL